MASRFRRAEDKIAAVIGVLLFVLVVELAILLAAQFIPVGVDAEQNAQINKIPLESAYDTRQTNFSGCVRGNVRSVAQVQDALDRAAGNAARAMAWATLLGNPLTVQLTPFLRGQIAANRHEAAAARAYAAKLIHAQRSVAKDPHDPRLAHRIAVDCRAVFPLPAHRGDPLPTPTKP